MKATVLRTALILTLLLLVVGCGAAGWWTQGLLAEKVLEADHARIDAEISQLEVQRLQQLKETLAKDKDLIERTKQIAVAAEQYKYQDQVVGDIGAYAARHNIQIATLTFANTQQKPASGSSAPEGATKATFTVTLKGSIPFGAFMQFLGDIESNLTKMQVTSLALTPDSKDSKLVSTPTLNLEVYIKK